MTFLPIVDRELRVAARKRSTFWLRLVAALVALVIGGAVLLLSLAFGTGVTQLGSGLFQTLTWMSLAVALGAGVFFTSDSLSEEKREGTLGLLFLTDLRGHDVVLGKLFATSLRGSFALLAVFPVLAITLLLGGVTGGQFWRTVLAIVNALSFSLAAGLFASAISREPTVAVLRTLGLLVLAVAFGPVADGLLAGGGPFAARFSLSSPGFAFIAANRSGFWQAFFVNQLMVWALLGAAAWLVARRWPDDSSRHSLIRQRRLRWWKGGGEKRHTARRGNLLDLNPALWLATRERWQGLAVWLFASALVALFAGLGLAGFPEAVWALVSLLGGLLLLLLYLWIALQACRFFVEARRSGLLELLLATPLGQHRLVHGPWQALGRVFAVPAVLCVSVQRLTQILAQEVTMGGLAGTLGLAPMDLALSFVGAAFTALATLANLAALAWFGLWMGLTTKTVPLATLKTLLFVQIIPSLVIGFLAGLMIPLLMMTSALRGTMAVNAASTPNFILWMPLLTTLFSAGLSLAKDAFFIIWARWKLLTDFREVAAQGFVPVAVRTVPPVITVTSPR